MHGMSMTRTIVAGPGPLSEPRLAGCALQVIRVAGTEVHQVRNCLDGALVGVGQDAATAVSMALFNSGARATPPASYFSCLEDCSFGPARREAKAVTVGLQQHSDAASSMGVYDCTGALLGSGRNKLEAARDAARAVLSRLPATRELDLDEMRLITTVLTLAEPQSAAPRQASWYRAMPPAASGVSELRAALRRALVGEDAANRAVTLMMGTLPTLLGAPRSDGHEADALAVHLPSGEWLIARRVASAQPARCIEQLHQLVGLRQRQQAMHADAVLQLDGHVLRVLRLHGQRLEAGARTGQPCQETRTTSAGLQSLAPLLTRPAAAHV